MSKTEFFQIYGGKYEHYRDNVYRLKDRAEPIVKDAEYIKWDGMYAEVEVFKKRKIHLGAISSRTLKYISEAVRDRKAWN